MRTNGLLLACIAANAGAFLCPPPARSISTRTSALKMSREPLTEAEVMIRRVAPSLGFAALSSGMSIKPTNAADVTAQTAVVASTAAKSGRVDLYSQSLLEKGAGAYLTAAKGGDEGQEMTVLQRHIEYFDMDKDGKISLPETYTGFRRIGANVLVAAVASFVINFAFTFVTSTISPLPDPSLGVYTANIQKAMHGSDQEVYTKTGSFRKESYNEIFARWDSDNKGGLSLKDVWRMTQGTTDAFDLFGWFAGKLEWGMTWLLCKNEDGLLTKDTVMAMYDGSLWYKMEAKRTGRQELLDMYAQRNGKEFATVTGEVIRVVD